MTIITWQAPKICRLIYTGRLKDIGEVIDRKAIPGKTEQYYMFNFILKHKNVLTI